MPAPPAPRVLFPFLLGAVPMLDFAVANHDSVPLQRIVVPLLATESLTAAALVLLSWRLGDVRRAGAIVSLWLMAALGDGHLHAALSALAWLGVWAGTVAFWRWRGDLRLFTHYANAAAAVAWLVPLGIWSFARLGDDPPTLRAGAAPPAAVQGGCAGRCPDVVYVLLDGYARADILAEHFGLEDPLPAALRARGFSVAGEARANYPQTALSLASALNMDYLPALLDIPEPASLHRLGLAQLIADNRVFATARRAGYHTVAYASEYSPATVHGADEVRRSLLHFDDYDHYLLNNTVATRLLSVLGLPRGRVQHAIRRRQLAWLLDDLARPPPAGSPPTFTFAHLVVPHPPFVWRPDGAYRPSQAKLVYADGDGWTKAYRGLGEDYREGYRDSVLFIGAALTRLVDRLTATARGPQVIVLHSDHGSGLKTRWGSAAKSDLRERLGILHAVRLPSGAALPAEVTPVNTFRLVFNEVLGTHLPLLDNRSYFAPWRRPYAFEDVSEAAGRGGGGE